MSTIPRSARVLLAVAGLALLVPAAAGAATATTTVTTKAAGSPIFCAQVANSQKAIAAVSKTAKDRNARIAAEWAKIDRFAPASLRKDTAAVAAAYAKAAKQTGSAAAATLATTAAAGKRITDFATKSCASRAATSGAGQPGQGPGRGREGDDEGDHEHGDRPDFDNPAFQACLASKGVSMPPRPQPGRGAKGDREGDHGRRPEMDDATHAAFEACRAQSAAATTSTVKA